MVGRRVLKFGGAALRDGDSVNRVAEIVRTHGGARPIVVVSAHAGVTDLLERSADEAAAGRVVWDDVRVRHRTLLRQLDLPEELLERLLRELRAILRELAAAGAVDGRSRDFVLSFGERLSARIVGAALRLREIEATPLDAFDLGLVHEPGAKDGPGVRPPSGRVGDALAAVPGVPVVTGFLAQDAGGHVVTLGRNGSDLSAAWVAEAVGAAEVQLWKTVPGILTADPTLVPAARPVPDLGWAEATELAAQGASILHPGAVEPARRAGVPIRLRSFADPAAPGTRIPGEAGDPPPLVLTHRPAVRLVRAPLDPGRRRVEELSRHLVRLRAAGAAPWLGEASTRATSFVCTDATPIEDLEARLPAGVEVERGLATLGVVGRDAARAATRLRRVLVDTGFGPRPAPGGTAPRGILFLVPAVELQAALRTAHAFLVEGRRVTPFPNR